MLGTGLSVIPMIRDAFANGVNGRSGRNNDKSVEKPAEKPAARPPAKRTEPEQ